MNSNKKINIVVFDMDETLGHFQQLSIFWESFCRYKNNKVKLLDFIEIIDLFPKVLRPNILSMLEFLKVQKINKKCHKIIIFTNNPNKKWCSLIKQYFNYKLNYPLFDQLIIAYEYNGKILEPKRTQYIKDYNDLLECMNYTYKKDPNILFLDDVNHEGMKHENVTYLKLKPYIYSYKNINFIVDYYKDKKESIDNKQEFLNKMLVVFLECLTCLQEAHLEE